MATIDQGPLPRETIDEMNPRMIGVGVSTIAARLMQSSPVDQAVRRARAGYEAAHLPANFSILVQMSGELAAVVANILHPHPDLRNLIRLSPQGHDEAVGLLATLEPLCAPASIEVLTAFLMPVYDGVANKPDQHEFARTVAALHLAAVGVPHLAWTQEAQRDLLASCKYMPSVREIMEAATRPVRSLISKVRALRIIVAAPP